MKSKGNWTYFELVGSSTYQSLSHWGSTVQNLSTVGPRFNEVPRDRGNLFILSRVYYIAHLHLKNFQDNYQNVCYIEVKLIINLQNPAFPDVKNYCYNISVPSQYIATTLETQEQANNTA